MVIPLGEGIVDNAYREVFANNKNLKTLKLEGIDEFSGQALQYLDPYTFEELVMKDVYEIDEKIFLKHLQKFNNLRTLTLNMMSIAINYSRFNEIFQQAILLFPNLEKFDFYERDQCYVDFYYFRNCIPMLPRLQKLDLQHDPEDKNRDNIGRLTNTLIRKMCETVDSALINLHFLDLSCNNITDVGLKILSKIMPNLTTLKINKNLNFKGKSLCNFKSLSYLECKECPVTESNLIMLLKINPNVFHLNILKCKKVKNNFINDVVSIMETRNDKKILTIHLDDNLVNEDMINHTSPFLYLFTPAFLNR